MKAMNINYIAFIACILVELAICSGVPGSVLAYQIETLPNTSVEGDVVLGPGKIEAWLAPGETTAKMLYFTNRTGRPIDFTVNVEDFQGSRDPKQGTVFMGAQKGPYSLKDYLKPDTWTFTLQHGQRISLPVEIAIPQDAEPGGMYGVVFATAAPPSPSATDQNQSESKPMIGIAARVGCLFFVRVKGEAVETGLLKSFGVSGNKSYFEQGPISFDAVYENNGNVHLNPYGTIEITNLLGKKAGQLAISPFFALPQSDRLSQAKWDRNWLFGKYTATISLNRGYQDIVDTKSISFWVIPWKFLLAGMAALFLVIWFIAWMFGKFEIKKKA